MQRRELAALLQGNPCFGPELQLELFHLGGDLGRFVTVVVVRRGGVLDRPVLSINARQLNGLET